MPQIEGLKEQKAALQRVKQNLKVIENINSFIKSVAKLSKEPKANIQHQIEVSVESGEDFKRFKCPMVISDNNYIFEAVLKYKKSIVEKVNEDTSKYHISLSAQETAALEWEFVSEQDS